MKVKELIKKLKTCDGNKNVFVAVDEEGNDFKGIDEVCVSNGEERCTGEKIEGYILYPIG